MVRPLNAIVVLVVVVLSAGNAQMRDKSTDKTTEKQSIEDLLTKARPMQAANLVPMEGAIDPSKYVLGPSDILTVSLWGIVSFSANLTVTPEGSLIIPTVGEIQVSGKKLLEAKKIVGDLVRQKYPNGSVTTTLTNPRSFIVTLRGAVLRQGQFVASAVDRVEQVLRQGASSVAPTATMNIPAAGLESDGFMKKEGQTKIPQISQQAELYENASTRNILVLRRNGDSLRVDIPKFYATGADECNPFLLDGDIIFVPMKSLSRNAVGVYGAVNSPGRYEFAEGDSLLALLQIAQGTTLAAELGHVKIQRVNDQGVQTEEIEVNMVSRQDGRHPNAALQRGDRIIVPTKEEYRDIYTVTVAGEIAKPGVYPIARSGTRISKVLSEVGGFTTRALLSGATLLRRDEDSKEVFGSQLNYLRNLRSQQLTSADSGYFSMDLRVGRHPVVLDFVKLLADKDSTQDVMLMNDDFIYIPMNTQTVLVHGQVQNPGYLPYVPGMEYQYYIEKAGGYSELAVSGDTKVVKKSTLEWIDPSDTTIQPGDQVWVPKKPIRDFSQTFPILRDIIAVTASLATAVILGFQVFR